MVVSSDSGRGAHGRRLWGSTQGPENISLPTSVRAAAVFNSRDPHQVTQRAYNSSLSVPLYDGRHVRRRDRMCSHTLKLQRRPCWEKHDFVEEF